MKLILSKDEINSLPLGYFKGGITVIDSLKDAKDALKVFAGETILGFDSETKPSFKKGQVNPVALIQLSSEKAAIIFRIFKMGMPLELKKILENEKIIKIAQEPCHEIRKIYEEYGTRLKGVVDLMELSSNIDCSPKSLRGLCAIFLGFRISKQAQTSNWEREILTEKQIIYAATDAWVARQVFMKMKKEALINIKDFDFKNIKKKIEYIKDGEWKDIETKIYKTDTDSFKNIIRRVLVDSSFPAINYELRYFEVEKEGYSSFEEHFHTHTVIISRGEGKVKIGRETFHGKVNDVFFIPPWEHHQLIQLGDEPFGFFCIVPLKRDKPKLVEKNLGG